MICYELTIDQEQSGGCPRCSCRKIADVFGTALPLCVWKRPLHLSERRDLTLT